MFIDSTEASIEAAKIGTVCVAAIFHRLDPETASVRYPEIKRCTGSQGSGTRIR